MIWIYFSCSSKRLTDSFKSPKAKFHVFRIINLPKRHLYRPGVLRWCRLPHPQLHSQRARPCFCLGHELDLLRVSTKMGTGHIAPPNAPPDTPPIMLPTKPKVTSSARPSNQSRNQAKDASRKATEEAEDSHNEAAEPAVDVPRLLLQTILKPYGEVSPSVRYRRTKVFKLDMSSIFSSFPLLLTFEPVCCGLGAIFPKPFCLSDKQEINQSRKSQAESAISSFLASSSGRPVRFR